ncbi:phosphonate degradation HD-domain oxygenase [Fimbriiglobus ruber]|uniref:HD domain-containing protein n=1 Tax=Fimbriiglobus ruber TaxID=1908690 RepID=A0A225DVY5_9BACT|nr:phosphonate degradation HD-domain oxygenase [Fimbriiglobus ruber]OWK43724.1 hypothetical protein FRUB_03323 [Fimbriiglobus ruber]
MNTPETATPFLDRIDALFADRGAAQYGGEAVSQLEHALQAALLAEQSGAGPELVTAALLHDVGHLLHAKGEDCVDRGIDDEHENLGYRFLTRMFGPAVSEPVRLHVPAKRFLCTSEPSYQATLSPASVLSLSLQGGPMTADEVAEFRRHPQAEAAVALRRWDDEAKVPGLPTPPFAHFRPLVEAALVRSA